MDEISEQLDEETSATEYGFQKEWEDEEDEDSEEQEDLDIELQATETLLRRSASFQAPRKPLSDFACLCLLRQGAVLP